jgi:unsaturated rhamnogalacturonyl hydrolase
MPTVRNVQLDRVTATAAPRVLYVRGFPGATVDDIRINDSTFKGLTQSEVVQGAGTISFRNVTCTPASLKPGKNSVPSQH